MKKLLVLTCIALSFLLTNAQTRIKAGTAIQSLTLHTSNVTRELGNSNNKGFISLTGSHSKNDSKVTIQYVKAA